MTMNLHDEEKFILDQVLSARHDTEFLKTQARELRLKINQAEQREAACEQAFADFMLGNGLTQTQVDEFSITLGKSTSVDVTDIDSVPEKYIRTKITKEVNKALIKAEGLSADGNNWLKYSEKNTITIKHKDA